MCIVFDAEAKHDDWHICSHLTLTTTQVSKLDLQRVTGGSSGGPKSFLTLPSSRASSRPSTARESVGPSQSVSSTRTITRRYRFGSDGAKPLEKLLPQTSHFDIVPPQEETGLAVPSKRDYLRIYYSDYLSQRPPALEDKPQFADDHER